jgi:hypothetical protein
MNGFKKMVESFESDPHLEARIEQRKSQGGNLNKEMSHYLALKELSREERDVVLSAIEKRNSEILRLEACYVSIPMT